MLTTRANFSNQKFSFFFGVRMTRMTRHRRHVELKLRTTREWNFESAALVNGFFLNRQSHFILYFLFHHHNQKEHFRFTSI
jgi:hypothetical protein